jgi:quinoprotein glucose dehydrogenase
LLLLTSARAQHQLASGQAKSEPFVAAASKDGELAIKKFELSRDLKVDLWAAEPMLANPVAFNFDERGRAFVCETFRLGAGVDDIRGLMDWLDEELASRSVDDRLAEMKRHLGDRFSTYTQRSERIRMIEDRDGDGKADNATVFADGFNTPLDGIGAGVLPRDGKVWYANIPNLWFLQDKDGNGVADERKSLHYGFGVRVGFLGHDLHGLHFGPDGKIYFSIGDRGSNIRIAEGRTVGEPDMGCVFRCNPDGSELEVFATGLRNPQDLVFDQYGNLFTGDNNSDSGDEARWVYVVEGGDSGWRVGYQFMENPYSRGPFNEEKLWYPHFEGQAAYIVPPIANIASGPSGVAYFPGTGLPARYQNHFFLVDFRGGAVNSGVHTFTLKPKGAYFDLVSPEHFLWGILATDVKFGPAGGIYVSDWVEGWGLTGKGRIYRVHDPSLDQNREILETKRLLAERMELRTMSEQASLLDHADIRVRQAAQFALAERGAPALKTLVAVASRSSNQLARLHAIWAIGQIGSRSKVASRGAEVDAALEVVTKLLESRDAEVRAQAAKVLGDCHFPGAYNNLVGLLRDQSSRVRFFAAISLGKLGRNEAIPAVLQMLRDNSDKDPYLRHAGVMALTRIGDVDLVLGAAKDSSPAVRMGALLALRRWQRPEITMFLNDTDAAIVLEAARAINDEPINGGMKELASLINRTEAGAGAPLLRRVLNANFHVGTAETAKALAAFAERSGALEAMRVEALEELADWVHPSGRDRVVGLWRPMVAHRPREQAVEALSSGIAELMRSSPDKVRRATLHAISRLAITNSGPGLLGLLGDKKVAADVRVEALNAISLAVPGRIEEAVNLAQADENEEVRKAALRYQVMVKSSNPTGKIADTLSHGTIGEKQAALAALGTIPGQAADEILEQWLDRLLKGELPGELQLDLLEAAGKRSAEPIKERLVRYKNIKVKDEQMAPYQAALLGGTAAEGKKIFFERPDAQCVRCHKINGQGGDVGPDLSHVGAQKDRNYLLESIVFPNRQIAPGFDSVSVTLKDGDTSYAGVLKSETPTELSLQSSDGKLVTVKKSEIQARGKALSPMPEGMAQILSRQDLRNLVEFLSSLK